MTYIIIVINLLLRNIKTYLLSSFILNNLYLIKDFQTAKINKNAIIIKNKFYFN